MNDYISREAALKKLQMQLLDLEADQDKGEYSELCENRGARDALDEAIYDIRTLKPADVQPVKYGRWSECYTDSIHYSGICTACKSASVRQLIEKPYDFCPRCGARMIKDGDKE